jgi:hypothetical protein
VRRVLVRLTQVGLALFLLIQLVPYGWTKDNPPVVHDAPWHHDASAQLARDAGYDCNRNETEWPVYSYVDWGDDAGEADDAIETLLEGEMPPSQYELLHPAARLSDDEVDRLVAALEAMEASDD